MPLLGLARSAGQALRNRAPHDRFMKSHVLSLEETATLSDVAGRLPAGLLPDTDLPRGTIPSTNHVTPAACWPPA